KTLAEEAFYGCTGLKNLTIEEGLSEISASAFYGCSGLKRVRIPVSVTSIARKAFYNCGSLTDVYYFGSEEQWNAVSIESTNHTVTDAAKHFNAAPQEHVWDDGTVTTAPTCTDEGVLTIACVFCDARRTEPVEATGHSYGAWVKYNGTYHKRVCANDETHYEVEKHKWNAGKITKAATCTVAGVKTYTCTVCGQTKKVSVAATGHDWGAWTNYDAAQHHRVCGNDASHIEYEDHAWNAGVITKKPTCTAKGVRTYTCTVCGAKKTASVKAKGHKYGEWQKLDDTLHQKVCANDASHVITEEHTWDEGVVTKEPTTASLGVRTFTCAVCGGTKTESIPKLLAKLAPTAANTATGIKLTWKKDPNAKGYYVFRKTGTGNYVTLKKITSNATVTYEDTTVADGVAYTYGVRSYRGTEKGDYTAKKITRLAPITPTAENVVGGVKLTWPKVAGATGYYVFRKTGSGSYKTLETIKSAETVSYTDTTAQSGVVYTYGVRAYKSTTKGAYTPQSICCLGAVSPTLTNLAGGVSVKWTQIAGATGYEIYRKTGSGSLTLIKTINAGATVSFTDTAVKSSNGTVYTYAVKAFNASTAASYTEKKIDRVLTVAFTSLTNPLNGAMNVKWKQNEAASGYQIQYATNSDFSGAKTVTVKYSESVSKTIQGLTKGNTYYVRLRVYATVDEVNYYSTWNTAKTVQIVK
ncbi:MAG: leucine-rich repeat protein, partial [Clostridia bacterium]|nr:leucine-rich repeat protein [Clostridia bacterium]